MKKFLNLLILWALAFTSVHAYRNLPSPVVVGDKKKAEASAAFEVNSTTQGFLPSRMTTAQRDAIVSPSTGLFIYNTDLNSLQTFGGVVWSDVGGGGADHPEWTTGTDYEIGSIVIESLKVYRANTAHTSGATFAGDIANWDEVSDDLNRESSVTDNALVVWDGAGGDDVKNSSLIVSGASSENLTTSTGALSAATVTGTTSLTGANILISGNTVEATNASGDINLDTNGGTIELVDAVNAQSTLDVQGNLTVEGDFTVNGTTTTINSATLAVTDQQITVNDGGTQASADLNDAGIEVEMSDATNAGLYYDSTFTSLFGVGLFNDFREIVTVDQAQDVTGKTLLEVDNLQLNGNTLTSTDTNGNTIITSDGTGVVQIDQADAEFIGTTFHYKPNSGTDGIGLRPSASALSFYRESTNGVILNLNSTQTAAYSAWRFLQNQGTKTTPVISLGDTTTGINYEFDALNSGDAGIYLIADNTPILNAFESGVDIPTVPLNVGEVSIGATANMITTDSGNLTIASASNIILDPTSNVQLPDLTVSQPAYIDASGNLISQDLSLTADVTGTLPEANGGTGVTDMSTILVELAGDQTISGSKTFDDAITMLGIASPSSPSAGDYKLYFKTDGNLYKKNSAGTEVQVDAGATPAYSYWSVSEGAGHGSTNTFYRRTQNSPDEDVGSDITYADSATLGATWTINTSGMYNITYYDFVSSGSGVSTIGVTVNDSESGSAIVAKSNQDEILCMTTITRSTHLGGCSTTRYLTASDVIRIHTDGNPDATTSSFKFSISRVW